MIFKDGWKTGSSSNSILRILHIFGKTFFPVVGDMKCIRNGNYFIIQNENFLNDTICRIYYVTWDTQDFW